MDVEQIQKVISTQTSTSPPPTLKIQLVDASDGPINDVLPLFQQYVSFYKWEQTLSASRDFLQKRVSNGSKLFLAFICPQNGSGEKIPVGFAHLYPVFSTVFMEENWLINDLFVDPHYRGEFKIGTSLLYFCIEWARQEGAFHIEINTRLNNPIGQHLYPKCGFVEYLRYNDRILYRQSFEKGAQRKYPTYYLEKAETETETSPSQEALSQ